MEGLPKKHRHGIKLVMSRQDAVPAASRPVIRSERTARTIRFPDALRARLAADAERCGRSLEAQVLAILRRHYGEDVDLAPAPDVILGLARASLSGVSDDDQDRIAQRLRADELR